MARRRRGDPPERVLDLRAAVESLQILTERGERFRAAFRVEKRRNGRNFHR